MRPIQSFEDIENLKTGDKLVEIVNGVVTYYKFLCLHPTNKNYVILLDACEEPVRFYFQRLIDRFYTDATQIGIAYLRKKYFQEELDSVEGEIFCLECPNDSYKPTER